VIFVHKTFEHTADVGVMGNGKTVDDAFAECGVAMFSIMAPINSIEPKKAMKFKAKSNSLEGLLVAFLNELLYMKDTKKMLYSKIRARIIFPKFVDEKAMNSEISTNTEKKDSLEKKEFIVESIAFGSKMSEIKEMKTEVKAATLSEVFVGKEKGLWVAKCIVDV
jgi:SHS2 domain-containing protein